MGFQQICESAVVENDGALGCVLIDLRTGLTLASAQRRGAELDGAEVKTILRSCEDLFCGKLISQFVAALDTDRPSVSGFMREVQITKTHHYQFMAALPGWDDAVVILVTERTLNLGLAWMVVHQTQTQLADVRRNAGDDRLEQLAAPPPADVAQSREGAAHAGPGEDPGQDVRPSAPPLAPAPSPPAATPVPPRPPASAGWTEAPESRKAADAPPAPVTVAAPARSPVSPPEPPMPAAVPDEAGAGERRSPVAERSAAEPEERPDDAPEPGPTVASGPRARMFRPRGGKKRRGS